MGQAITSRRNALVETFRQVARARPAETVLLDGIHLVEEALAAGMALEVAACTERVLAREDGRTLAQTLETEGVRLVRVTEEVLDAMSPVTTPSGVVALGHLDRGAWDALVSPPPALVLMAVDVQDPGNLGALVRVADAAGGTGLVTCGETADPFGWKALRGAMGSAFRLPVRRESSVERALDTLRGHGLRLIATGPGRGTPLDACDLTRPCAVLLGSEGHGLDGRVRTMADEILTIPMRPPVESLNVAVAGALIAFEAARQRQADR